MRRFLFAAGSYGLSILLAGLGTWWNFLDVQVLITYMGTSNNWFAKAGPPNS